MESVLAEIAHYAGMVIEAMALIIIVVSSIEAFVAGARVMLSARATNEEKRAIAVIRTFLNYFLERDMKEMRLRQEAHERERSGEPQT